MKEMPLLNELPEGWKEKIVSEDDPKIHPESWKLGQVGMVGNVIKPIDQEGVNKGQMRVIFVDTPPKENPRDDLL